MVRSLGLSEPIERAIVLPADDGLPRGRGLRGGVERDRVEAGRVWRAGTDMDSKVVVIPHGGRTMSSKRGGGWIT